MTTLSTVRTRRHRLLVGGQWTDPAAGETAVLHSPATGEPVADAMTHIRSVAFDVAGGAG